MKESAYCTTLFLFPIDFLWQIYSLSSETKYSTKTDIHEKNKNFMNDIKKQKAVEKEFRALKAHIGKKILITYVSATEPSTTEKATLLAVEKYKFFVFKKRTVERVSFFIWDHYGIQKIATPEGAVLYENTTLDFSLSDDEETNKNMLKERKFGTDKYNTNFNKFKKVAPKK